MCGIIITNFIKVLNNFKCFLNMFTLFNTQLIIGIIFKQICSNTMIYIENNEFLLYYFIWVMFTIIYKNIVKILCVDMVWAQKHSPKTYATMRLHKRGHHNVVSPNYHKSFNNGGWGFNGNNHFDFHDISC
jgi:hypothetical protein